MGAKVDTTELKRLLDVAFDAVVEVQYKAESLEHHHPKIKDAADAAGKAKWQILEAEQYRKDYLEAVGE